MSSRICLTCKHWKRHNDLLIGTCAALGDVAVKSLRFQFETCDKACPSVWEFGQEREPYLRDKRTGDELVSSWGIPYVEKVNQYYKTTLFEAL